MGGVRLWDLVAESTVDFCKAIEVTGRGSRRRKDRRERESLCAAADQAEGRGRAAPPRPHHQPGRGKIPSAKPDRPLHLDRAEAAAHRAQAPARRPTPRMPEEGSEPGALAAWVWRGSERGATRTRN